MDGFCSFSVSHLGAKHDSETPCQDASGHFRQNDAMVAVVADGHGSKLCFRSDIGSAIAIDTVKKVIEPFTLQISKIGAEDGSEGELEDELASEHETGERITPEDFKDMLHEIARQIIDKWFAAVMKDTETKPLSEDPRMAGIEQKYIDRYTKDIDYRCHAYGTTLIAVAMSENYWFGLQIGDGKCVILYEDGSWKLPIPWDDNCSFNTTTSICDDDSLSKFRYWFGFNDDGKFVEYGYGVKGQDNDYITNTESRPLAVFIGSDGVEDSYPVVDNDSYIINFYRKRIITLAESGFESFKDDIDKCGEQFADRGSTDDVSIAAIVGDFTDKSALIQKLKHESRLFDAVMDATAKRRDADEKKDVLAAMESSKNNNLDKLKLLDSSIKDTEQRISVLKEKKASLLDIDTQIQKGQEKLEQFLAERDTIKKQTDKLTAIKEAWEKAEQEAQEAERLVQVIRLSAEDGEPAAQEAVQDNQEAEQEIVEEPAFDTQKPGQAAKQESELKNQESFIQEAAQNSLSETIQGQTQNITSDEEHTKSEEDR